METYFESPENSYRLKILTDDHHCEKLFDQLFTEDKHNDNNNEDLELNFKRPIKTYEKKSRFVRFFDENDEEDNSDNDGDDENDNFDALFNTKNNNKDTNKAKKPRKKKLAYPNVSKDAVLEAFNKAIENQELPNFDEIEKFPLTIVTETEIEKEKSEKKNAKKNKKITTSTPAKSTTTTSKQIKKSSNKSNNQNNNNNDKENPVSSTKSSSSNQTRRSNRTKRILGEIDSNQPINNQSTCLNDHQYVEGSEKNLFNLDESCIHPETLKSNTSKSTITNTRSSSRIAKNNNAIKSSTPFASMKNVTKTRGTKQGLTTAARRRIPFSTKNNNN